MTVTGLGPGGLTSCQPLRPSGHLRKELAVCDRDHSYVWLGFHVKDKLQADDVVVFRPMLAVASVLRGLGVKWRCLCVTLGLNLTWQ